MLYTADAAAGLLLATDAFGADAQQAEVRVLPAAATALSTQAAAQTYATAPMTFEANRGQFAASADYAAYGSGYSVQVNDSGVEIRLAGASSPIRLTLIGANASEATGEGLLQARSNYLLGGDAAAWRTDVENYRAVLYSDVYDSVDLRYYGTQRQLEYDFVLRPGADAQLIQLRVDGAQASIAPNGDLVLTVAGAAGQAPQEIRFHAPVSYQIGEAGREAVASAYVLGADGTVGFAVGAYDAQRELVIDPVLTYASYFGGVANDTGVDVAVAADGTVYVTGRTTATTGDLANLIGSSAGAGDVYVAHFSADLSTLLWSTRVGGSLDDQPTSIAVDSAGNVAVAGSTKSSAFPMVNAADSSRAGNQDAFVFKLNTSGTALVFSTYFGSGGNNDVANDVAFDSSGAVYVTGVLDDNNILNLSKQAAFINKYSATGAVVYQKTIDGNDDDAGKAIAVDAAGQVYVAGDTQSDNLPIVGGILGLSLGNQDAFMAKLNAAGSITYSSYIAGNRDDFATGIAIDGTGLAYVVGTTQEPDHSDFATTPGAAETTRVRHTTGYLRVYDTNVTGNASLVYSSFVGGSRNADGDNPRSMNDRPTGVALSGGDVVVFGYADSANLYTTPDAYSSTNSNTSGFFWVIDPQGSGRSDIVYGTYYGAGLTAGGVAATPNAIYLVGSTSNDNLSTPGAYRGSASAQDALVAIFTTGNHAPVLAGANNLQPVREDSGAGAGTLVSDLIAGQVTDSDASALGGIAITAAQDANGVWQYTTNGTTWSNLGTVSAGSARLLSADAVTRVRFVPAADYVGTSSITFRAWDRTSGTAGGVGNASTGGWDRAYSVASATSSISVTPVNDAPVLLAGTLADLTVLENSGTTTLGFAGLGFGPGGGVDEASQTLSVSIVTVPAPALGDIVLADGSTVVTAGATFTIAQLQGMQFRAATGGTGGPATFKFNVRDSGGTADG
ncbi:beta strand repeat-containing protein, partial [Caenimonas koreensis]|uniref:beta strand repeat-containing protein n=1 Tax=Caenimonas koreensis TaxID=367474 RepID=UPI0037835C02